MKAGITDRIRRLESKGGPGSGPAMVIDRRPGESREQAAQRYFSEYPERLGDRQTPKIYLSLERNP